ncbi:MAG: hypothetical protein SO141_01525 [Alphaproteobacteria bacterium]|nr:hypothetical protein [Alphaproteobacteria bacterium]
MIKKIANLSNLDYRVKPDNDSVCTGRSMVEMLGVLAIIGVLSVGAIAGYSKAMMKYKLNLVTNSANQLIATIIEKNHLNGNSFTTSTPTTKTFINAGWIPDGFTADQKNSDYIHDSFENNIWLFKTTDYIGISFGWSYQQKQTEICHALLNVGKEWKADLYYLQTDYSADPDNNIEQKTYGQFYGDTSCSSNVKCLRDLSLTDIYSACDKCERDFCRIFFITKAVK